MGRVRVVRPDGAAGATWSPSRALRRAVVLARRPEDRVPPSRRRSDARPVLRRRRGHLRRRRPLAASRCWSATGAPIRSSITPARASTCAKSATRSSRSSASALPTGDSPLPGPRRDRARAQRQRHAVRASRRTASGSRSRNGSRPTSRRSRGRDGRSTSDRRRSRTRCSGSPATRVLPALVGRQPAAVLGARAGAVLARCCATRSHSRRRTPQAGAQRAPSKRPEAKGIPIGFTAKSDKPSGAIALVGARVITMAGLKPGPIAGTPGVIENATVARRGQPHRRRRPASSVQVPASAQRIDVKGKTIMPGIDRRARASRRRVERAARAIELAAGGQPRVRRHDVARSVERHRNRVHECGADSDRRASWGRACSRPARSSTAPKRRSRRSSRATTTRCRTCGGRRPRARSR